MQKFKARVRHSGIREIAGSGASPIETSMVLVETLRAPG